MHTNAVIKALHSVFSSIKRVDSHNSQEGEDCGCDKKYQIQLELESLGNRYSYLLCY